MSAKRPWMKWYAGDVLNDTRLRRVGYAANGLWRWMLDLMAKETDAYGYLVQNGDALEAADLAGIFGGSAKEVTTLLKLLEAKKIFSRVGGEMPDELRVLIQSGMPNGAIISRRMVRDKAKEDADKANGKTGGNPSLKPEANRGVNPLTNPPVKAEGVIGIGRGDNTQISEIRSQNDDARKPPSLDGPAEPRDPTLELAREIIDAYGRAVQEVWGLPTGPLPRHGERGDFATAKAWAEAGVTLELVLEVVGPVLTAKRDGSSETEPPGGLVYLDRAMRRKLSNITGKPAEPVDEAKEAAAQRYLEAMDAWIAGGREGRMPEISDYPPGSPALVVVPLTPAEPAAVEVPDIPDFLKRTA